MKNIKAVLCVIMLMLITVLPLGTYAVESQSTEPFSLEFICKINEVVPSDTQFIFSVTETPIESIDQIDGTIEYGTPTLLSDFTVNTKTDTNGKKVFVFPEKTLNGGFSYTIKLKSVSDRLSTVVSTVIKVDFKKLPDESEISIDGAVLPSEGSDEPISIITGIDDEPVVINCAKKNEVKISTEGLAAITKVYDGNIGATVTDKNYKLTGVKDGHEVKLSFNKAEFNSADVKKADKVIISGLSLTGKNAAEYGIAADSFEFKASITPRPITVTADKLVMTQGQTEPPLTYTLSEKLIEGNKAVGSLARVSGDKVGTYTVTRGTLMLSDNYAVTFVDGSLTISSYGFKEILDENTAIKISGHYDPKATVSASALIPEGEAYSILAAETKWGKILASYDITFTASSFDGQLNIAIPVGTELDGKTVTVYQLMSSGAITCYKPQAVNGYIAVDTDECTQFMLVTEKPAEKADKPSVAWTVFKVILIILAVIVGLFLIIALFFFGMIYFNKTKQLKAIIKAIRRLLKK